MVITKAKSLLKNGYQVIPITFEGIPLIKNFLDKDVEYNETHTPKWETWYPDASIALVAGKNNIFALDFDIDDADTALKMRRVLKKHWPDMPIRVCNNPRFAVVFKADHTLSDIKNAHSKGFKEKGGELQQIELIGNRIITIYGKHRKTGNAYKWTKGNNPLKKHSEDLPVLTLTDVKKLFKFYETRVPENQKEVSRSSFTKAKEEVTFENVGMQRIYTENEIDRYLMEITGDERKPWLTVGMALHHHFKGKKEGLHKWDEWSSQFKGYKGLNDCRFAWKRFNADGGTTIKTLEFMVNKDKKKPAEILEDFVNNMVLIKKGQKIADLRELANESVFQRSEVAYANTHVTVPVVKWNNKTKGDETVWLPIMDAWALSKERIICAGEEYLPSKQRLLQGFWKNRRSMYYNIYEPPMTDLTNREDLLPRFHKHMEYLFPNEGDTDWMYSWLAQLVQEPNIRYRVAPLSISTFHGTGRGWLSLLLHELVGLSNMTTIGKIGELVRDGAKNGFMNNSTLCVVAETYAGDKKYAVDDRLRNILGDNFQNVDIKYGEQKDKQVYTRFFFQSNHIDALVIDDVDTRIEVFINRQLPKEGAYYNKLYGLLEDESFVNQVYTYLMEYKINYDWLKTSRKTPARDTLIKATKSKTANALFEFKMIVGDKLFTDKIMTEFIAEYIAMFHNNDGLSEAINNKELNYLQREQLQLAEVIQLNDKSYRIKSFAPHDLSELQRSDIKRSVKEAKRKVTLFFRQLAERATDDKR